MSKTIVITGGASGIGLATAKHLAAHGWKVALIDLDQKSLEAAQARIPSSLVITVQADVADEMSLRNALQQVVDKSGGFQAIFNNAGVLISGTFQDCALSGHHKTIDINSRGVVNGCYLALPHLLKSGGVKHVINMSSASSSYGVPRLATYSASKAFVTNLTQALSLEWESHDISVSCIQVGFVNTPMTSQEGTAINSMVNNMGGAVGPEGVAYAIGDILNQDKKVLPVQKVGLALKLQGLLARFLPNSVIRSIYKHFDPHKGIQ